VDGRFVKALAFEPKGAGLVYSTDAVHRLDIGSGAESTALEGNAPIGAISVASDGSLLAAAAGGPVEIWDGHAFADRGAKVRLAEMGRAPVYRRGAMSGSAEAIALATATDVFVLRPASSKLERFAAPTDAAWTAIALDASATTLGASRTTQGAS